MVEALGEADRVALEAFAAGSTSLLPYGGSGQADDLTMLAASNRLHALAAERGPRQALASVLMAIEPRARRPWVGRHKGKVRSRESGDIKPWSVCGSIAALCHGPVASFEVAASFLCRYMQRTLLIYVHAAS